MPDVITEYLRASDNADDYAESLVDGLEQSRLEDVDELFTEESARDAELWTELGVSPELVIKDYEQEPVDDRDLEWSLGLAGLATAASTQFFLDNRNETIIHPVAYREQALDAFELTQAELVTAGQRLIDFEKVLPYQTLQRKYLEDLAFLDTMDNTELYNALREYGALRPVDKVVADSMGYVSRMTSYPPGSEQWKSAVNDLIDQNSARAIKGQNRRAVERIYSFREADGDMSTLMVWVGEGGKPCANCPLYYGEVRTYGEWIESGILPGASICAGGDNCRCHLAAAGLLAA